LPFDVTIPTQWDALLKLLRPDVIVHLAAETGTGQSLSEASRHSRVNVVGTTEMLDALTRAKHVPSHILLASSRAVYGEGRWIDQSGSTFYAAPRDLHQLESARWDPSGPEGTVGEVRPLPHRATEVEPRPTNIYAATKLAQEHILTSWVTARGSSLSVLRLQNVYGPGQSLTNPYTGIVSLFAQLAHEHQSIPVYEDGEIVRDFVYIEDVVAALSAASVARTDSVMTVDIGSSEPVTVSQLANEIARQGDAPTPTVTGAFRLGDVRAAYADISVAENSLGYTPKTTLSSGIQQLLAWVAESNQT
jgi:dTDP-L-rhamnose 4-epimerase